MRVSNTIVEGRFFGADIEPGTFHGSQGEMRPRSGCPASGLWADRTRQALAFDQAFASPTRDSESTPAEDAKRTSEPSDNDRSAEVPRWVFRRG